MMVCPKHLLYLPGWRTSYRHRRSKLLKRLFWHWYPLKPDCFWFFRFWLKRNQRRRWLEDGRSVSALDLCGKQRRLVFFNGEILGSIRDTEVETFAAGARGLNEVYSQPLHCSVSVCASLSGGHVYVYTDEGRDQADVFVGWLVLVFVYNVAWMYCSATVELATCSRFWRFFCRIVVSIHLLITVPQRFQSFWLVDVCGMWMLLNVPLWMCWLIPPSLLWEGTIICLKSMQCWCLV